MPSESAESSSFRSSSRPVSRIPNEDRPLLTDGCPRWLPASVPPVWCHSACHAYGAEPGAVREPPCASGTCSEQETGTRSLGSLCRELRATRVSAAHATAARAVARRGAACMRRRRELPRRPAVCRRLHQPPRALANSVHPCDAVRSDEFVRLKLSSVLEAARAVLGEKLNRSPFLHAVADILGDSHVSRSHRPRATLCYPFTRRVGDRLPRRRPHVAG